MDVMSKSSQLMLLAALLVMAGCRSETQLPDRADDRDIALENVWVRMMPDSLATRTAVYGDITNATDVADGLVGVDTEVAESVELHETTIEEDVMRMREVESFSVAPGATVALQPGGQHVMLIGMKQHLVEGDSLDLQFRFASGKTLSVVAPVRSH